MKPKSDEASGPTSPSTVWGFVDLNCWIRNRKWILGLVVGGSTTFDVFAPSDSQAWPALLGRNGDRRPDRVVEVINAGIPGEMIAGNQEDFEIWRRSNRTSWSTTMDPMISGTFALAALRHRQESWNRSLRCYGWHECGQSACPQLPIAGKMRDQ